MLVRVLGRASWILPKCVPVLKVMSEDNFCETFQTICARISLVSDSSQAGPHYGGGLRYDILLRRVFCPTRSAFKLFELDVNHIIFSCLSRQTMLRYYLVI